MLQEIKSLIYNQYKPEDKIGCFFSLFDDNWSLLVSNGVLTTDKSLEDLINLLYNGVIKSQENKVKHVIIDIVKEIIPQRDVNKFLQMDPKVYGVLLSETSGSKSGVMLPNMKWITTMKQVVVWIKSKYQLQWDVAISTFVVDELILDK